MDRTTFPRVGRIARAALLAGAVALGAAAGSGCVLRPLPALPCPCAEGYHCADGLCVLDVDPSIDGGTDAGSEPHDASTDAGDTDAALPTDAGPLDAATPPDAGALDAGASDAGPPDAGSRDAGSLDAGAMDGGHCMPAAFGSSIYLNCVDRVTWFVADAHCASLGMQLIRVDSSAENDFARGLSTMRIWTGGTDSEIEGVWRWQDGTTFWTGGLTGMPVGGAYTFWNPGEPNNGGSGEDCLQIRRDGLWIDGPCDLVDATYICEPR